jgi:hypothetical protein
MLRAICLKNLSPALQSEPSSGFVLRVYQARLACFVFFRSKGILLTLSLSETVNHPLFSNMAHPHRLHFPFQSDNYHHALSITSTPGFLDVAIFISFMRFLSSTALGSAPSEKMTTSTSVSFSLITG